MSHINKKKKKISDYDKDDFRKDYEEGSDF